MALDIDSRFVAWKMLLDYLQKIGGPKTSPNSLDSTDRSGAEESPGSVLAQAS